MSSNDVRHCTDHQFSATSQAASSVAACLGESQTLTQTAPCSTSPQKTEGLYQVAYLQWLTMGNYDGIISVAELKRKGDTGIGTFEGLAGEMVMLDGIVYQCLGDGSVRVASDCTTVPFANVAFLNNDVSCELSIASIKDLETQLTSIADEHDASQFYLMRFDAEFESIEVRSELTQQKPYEPLEKVLARDQREFSYDKIKGTIVALYCPVSAESINELGWHFHFISDDRSKGGHVLSSGRASGTATLCKIAEISIKMPNGSTRSGLT